MKGRVGKLIHAVTLLAVLTSVFSLPLTYFSFKVNQDFIARTQCDYRNISITVCAGSCVLEKKIKLLEEFQAPVDNQANKTVLIAPGLFCEDLTTIRLSDIGIEIEKSTLWTSNDVPQGLQKEIFHPPRLS